MTFLVTDSLHKAAKAGSQQGWGYQATNHIAIKDMQDFVKKNNLEHVEYGSTTAGRWMRVEIWGLEKFTAFDAYGDGPDKRHYGTVWTNPNGNAVGVVGPAVLHWKQKWKTDTAPEKTTVQCLVNSMRWNGATIALAAFKGTVDKTSKMKSLTQRHILRTKEEGVTAAIAALRERVWKLTSRLEMMASLGAINAYYTPTVTAVATTTTATATTTAPKEPPKPIVDNAAARAYLQKLRTQLATERKKVVCECEEGKCKCTCEEMEQRAIVFSWLDAAEVDGKTCEERLDKRVRTASLHAGLVFHPDTTCGRCDQSPIVGWRYRCEQCQVDLCQKSRCIASHDQDHTLLLIRTPPAVQESSPEHMAAVTQKWRVNCVLDRQRLKRTKGEQQQYTYLISWEGKDVGDTWETAGTLNNPALLATCELQFERTKKRDRTETRCVYSYS